MVCVAITRPGIVTLATVVGGMIVPQIARHASLITGDTEDTTPLPLLNTIPSDNLFDAKYFHRGGVIACNLTVF